MKTLLLIASFAVLCSAASAIPTTPNPTSSLTDSVGALPELVVVASRETTPEDETIGKLPEYTVIERAPAKAKKSAPAKTPATRSGTASSATPQTSPIPAPLRSAPVVASNGF